MAERQVQATTFKTDGAASIQHAAKETIREVLAGLLAALAGILGLAPKGK